MEPVWKKESRFFALKLAAAALLLIVGAVGTVYALRVFYHNGSFLSPFTLLVIAFGSPVPLLLALWLLYTSTGPVFGRKLLGAAWWFFVVFYCVILGFILFGGGRRDYDYSYLRPNFVPFLFVFKELSSAFEGRLDMGPLRGLIGNLALFAPLGFLLPWKMRGRHPKTASALLLLLAIVAVEVLQQVFVVGVFDIDDVLLNFLGVLMGVAAQGAVQKGISIKRTSAYGE